MDKIQNMYEKIKIGSSQGPIVNNDFDANLEKVLFRWTMWDCRSLFYGQNNLIPFFLLEWVKKQIRVYFSKDIFLKEHYISRKEVLVELFKQIYEASAAYKN